MNVLLSSILFLGVAATSAVPIPPFRLPTGKSIAPAVHAPVTPTAPAAAAAPAAPSKAAGDVFSPDKATAGLKGKGPLNVAMEIISQGQGLGVLHCELLVDKAPLTVANFVGLLRGLRPFKDPKGGQWIKRPFYENMTIHRVVPDYLIQAGDPACSSDVHCNGHPGIGEPGYLIPDEIDPSVQMDRGGMLAMANRKPNENGSQFFITDRATPWLQGKQTVFGRCAEVDLLKKISALPRDEHDMPKNAVIIKKMTLGRGAVPKAG
jgi:peptidyl-prolyl cis-trans isomerase A (cyclophilin A)